MRYLAFLLLLIALPAFGRGEAAPLNDRNVRAYRWIINDTYAVSTTGYEVGEAFPAARVSFTIGTDFEGVLWGCDTKTFLAAVCDDDPLLTIVAANATAVVYTARQYYVMVVDVDEGATTTSRLEIKGTDTNVAAVVDPSYTVRFENATMNDDPMVYAYTAVRLKGLYCAGMGGTTHVVEVKECDSNADNCAATGLTVSVTGVTPASSTTINDDYIDKGDYWGIHNESMGVTSTWLDCTVHAERG